MSIIYLKNIFNNGRMKKMKKRPVVLIILDGWGMNHHPEQVDAVRMAHPVNFERYRKEYPFTELRADGEFVGLPKGQFGNSEVGHTNIGAGRIVYQMLPKITKAIEEGITVVPLPGANAALTALIASGLDTKSFAFAGFLPKRGKHRIEELQRLSQVTGTLMFYEAPHRLQEVLQDMYEAFGNRSITVARELTKKFETFVRTDLESLVNDLEQLTYKGEFVLIVGGADTVESDTSEVSDEPVSYLDAVQALVETGVPKKEAIRQVAKRFNVSRRDVYNIVER